MRILKLHYYYSSSLLGFFLEMNQTCSYLTLLQIFLSCAQYYCMECNTSTDQRFTHDETRVSFGT